MTTAPKNVDQRVERLRYPLQPLINFTGMTHRDLGEHLGVQGRSVARAVQRGLSYRTAEAWASAVGAPAVVIWPTFGEIPCGNHRCTTTFAPLRARHSYCSRRCQKRVADRRHKAKVRRENPARAAAEAEYQARYRADLSERALAAQRAARRARYQANRQAELARQKQYDAEVRAPRRAAEREEAA